MLRDTRFLNLDVRKLFLNLDVRKLIEGAILKKKPVAVKHTCASCKKTFKEFKSHKRKYCSKECYGDSRAAKSRKRTQEERKKMPRLKKKRRACLGILCRGEKIFWSEGKHERICAKCKMAMKTNREDSFNTHQ